MRAQFEQLHIVVCGQRLAFLIVEPLPGAALDPGQVQDQVGPLRLPPFDRSARARAITLHQLGIAVDRVQELVEQVPAHWATPLGYHVK
jgi:hypothetical protein